ncbi:MAG: PspC domain-containing protein [Bacteroidales bacterium]|nr:PspC domain-containing protein [Bacteroidales bacterium]MBR5778836.1 PspC domain-containing protein [Bacteroidales bacterium]
MLKKLYRSRTDRKICGVCGGLAEYLNVDATIVRLVCVVASILTAVILGLLLYFVAALIIPEK